MAPSPVVVRQVTAPRPVKEVTPPRRGCIAAVPGQTQSETRTSMGSVGQVRVEYCEPVTPCTCKDLDILELGDRDGGSSGQGEDVHRQEADQVEKEAVVTMSPAQVPQLDRRQHEGLQRGRLPPSGRWSHGLPHPRCLQATVAKKPKHDFFDPSNPEGKAIR